MNKVLVVPDVHGRDFWKKVKDFDGTIIFLGDYHDPYPDEGITVEKSLENLKELLEFANTNSDRVVLLYGNHDTHYLDCSNSSRKDYKNLTDLKYLLNHNKHLFKKFYFEGGVLFTHAGVSKLWMEYYFGIVPKDVADILYLIDESDWNNFMSRSYYRGGYDAVAGPLWHDVREFMEDEDDIPLTSNGIKFQVFAHTRLNKKDFIKTDEFACIDCQEIFEIDLDDPKHSIKIWQN